MESILEFDTWLLLKVNGFHLDFLDPFMRMFSTRLVWVVMYVAIAAVMVWRYGWLRALIIVIAAGIAVGASDFLCASVIRPFFERLRPSNPDNPISGMVHIVDGYRSGSYGFPSCHAANTFALALFTSMVFRYWRYTFFIFLWALMQCYSRIYLGVHYPGDILAGALVGCIMALVVYGITFRRVSLSVDINHHANPSPAIAVGILSSIYIAAACVWPQIWL